MMTLASTEVHELKNFLGVSMGTLEMILRIIEKDGANVDLEKIEDLVQRSFASQRKIEELLRNKIGNGDSLNDQ